MVGVVVLREGVIGKTGWTRTRGHFQLVLRHNVLAVFRHMTAAADRGSDFSGELRLFASK